MQGWGGGAGVATVLRGRRAVEKGGRHTQLGGGQKHNSGDKSRKFDRERTNEQRETGRKLRENHTEKKGGGEC